MAADLSRLVSAVGHAFSDPELLDRALTHRSYGAEEGTSDNETLEFLGDAVIDAAVADLLMERHPGLREGALSRRRAALVSEESLARVAVELDLPSGLRLGKGEEASGGSRKPRLLASAYEALIGAVFLDGGYESARSCVAQHFRTALEEAEGAEQDSKTALQELTQQRVRVIPNYRVLAIEGPDHAPTYRVEVSVSGKALATGQGGSRKAAEQAAAELALVRLSENEGDGE